MDNLKDAKQVVWVFNKRGYEAYIVGGAVRDHLLNMPLSDIDITTNAKPDEVLKIFKGVPTGLKYGTVTITQKNATYEVTTFRSEKGYSDFRRPEVVDFEVTVEEDVKRRDFTINGLLMDEAGDIIDLVGGVADLEAGIIRTIGNPKDRFTEDALRMLRAFYFQSKLGFEIEENTLNGIFENRKLIREIASERVLDEINKMLKGKHLLKAFDSIIKSKAYEYLPGLDKGIKHLVEINENPKPIIFYSLAFHLNGSILEYWKFPNNYRYKIKKIMELIKLNKLFTNIELYHYGLENILLANEVKGLLKMEVQDTKKLEKMFEKLPIKSSLDLKLRAKDMLEITGKKAGAWVNNLTNDIVNKVLTFELENSFEAIKTYVLDNINRF